MSTGSVIVPLNRSFCFSFSSISALSGTPQLFHFVSANPNRRKAFVPSEASGSVNTELMLTRISDLQPLSNKAQICCANEAFLF